MFKPRGSPNPDHLDPEGARTQPTHPPLTEARSLAFSLKVRPPFYLAFAVFLFGLDPTGRQVTIAGIGGILTPCCDAWLSLTSPKTCLGLMPVQRLPPKTRRKQQDEKLIRRCKAALDFAGAPSNTLLAGE